MFSFHWTVNETFVRELTRDMTSRGHDEQYSTHMYAISYHENFELNKNLFIL